MTERARECTKCKSIKLLSDFYKQPAGKYGRESQCMVCRRASTVKSRAKYLKTDEGKATGVKYRKSATGKLNQSKAAAKYVKTEAGKLAQIKNAVKYQAANPAKVKARRAINSAVRSGKITKPSACEECNSTPSRLEGHHSDYSLLFTVRWLCNKCHASWHIENGPGLNG